MIKYFLLKEKQIKKMFDTLDEANACMKEDEDFELKIVNLNVYVNYGVSRCYEFVYIDFSKLFS